MKASINFHHHLLIISFLLFTFLIFSSMLFMRVSSNATLYAYDLTVFNLFFYVPMSVWIGIFGLVCLFIYLFLINNHAFSLNFIHALMFLAALIILIFFYGLPFIIEENPRFVDSWVHGRTVNGILINKYLTPEKLRYQAYPSSFIILAEICIVAGIELTLLLRIIPTFLIFTFFFTFIMFTKELFANTKLAIVASLIFGLSTYYLAFHFSPEAFGWVFFFLLLALLAKDIQNSKSTIYLNKKILILFTILSVTITHAVTQLSIVLLMFALYMSHEIWKIKRINYNTTTMITMVSFTGWAIFFGYQYAEIIIKSFMIAFEKVTLDITSSLIVRPLSEPIPSELSNLTFYRRITYILIFSLAIYGAFESWKNNNKKINLNIIFLLSIFAVGIIEFPLTVFGILPLERPIKLAFISLSIFSACMAIKKKKLAVTMLIFLLATIPLNFASFYWGEPLVMTHSWEISSAQFIGTNFNGSILGGFKETTILNFYGNFSKIYNDYYSIGERPDVFNFSFVKEKNIKLVYLTQLTIMKQSLIGKPLKLSIFINSTLFNCIHSSGYSITLSKSY